MDANKLKTRRHRRRKRHVRKTVYGGPDRPRLTVFRSLKHIYAQIIDDDDGRTLASASSRSKEIRDKLAGGGNVAAAEQVGALLGQKAKQAGIEQVVFDRNGFRYHGRVKALAEAVRQAGVKF